MHRERVVHPERFERLVSFVELLEKKGNYLNQFARLFEEETLNLTVNLG
jgi:hypothetical protein